MFILDPKMFDAWRKEAGVTLYGLEFKSDSVQSVQWKDWNRWLRGRRIKPATHQKLRSLGVPASAFRPAPTRESSR